MRTFRLLVLDCCAQQQNVQMESFQKLSCSPHYFNRDETSMSRICLCADVRGHGVFGLFGLERRHLTHTDKENHTFHVIVLSHLLKSVACKHMSLALS